MLRAGALPVEHGRAARDPAGPARRPPIRRSAAAAAVVVVASSIAVALAGAAAAQDGDAPRHLDVIEVNGLVDPVVADFVGEAVEQAEASGAVALVVQMNSSGAALPSDELDALVRRLERAAVPVAVWVGPTGADAGDEAVRLVDAADVSGIAPGARIEAADGRRLGAEAARRENVVDVFAPTLGDFIVELDGREVDGTTLSTARIVRGGDQPRREPTVQVRFAKLGLLARLLHTVASPSVAYLLLVIGLLLVVFEFFTAGVGIAGAVGAGSLGLSAYGLGVLPARWWAVALVAVAIGGYAIDVQAGAPRAWTVIGTLALAVGSFRLYDGLAVPWWTILLAVAGTALAMVAGMPAMVRTRFSTPTIGRESMIGALGEATSPVEPDGVVRISGALWRARTNRATPIPAGEPVRVVAIDGLLLEVEPEEGGARDAGH